MQCRALNCNPTFVHSDIIAIGRLKPPMLLFVSDLRVYPGGAGSSAVQKMGAGLAAVIRPVRIA
jgi:hypothetical protein